MRSLVGLLCFLTVAADAARPDPDLAVRSRRVAELASLLTDIVEPEREGQAGGLPDDLNRALEAWTGEGPSAR